MMTAGSAGGDQDADGRHHRHILDAGGQVLLRVAYRVGRCRRHRLQHVWLLPGGHAAHIYQLWAVGGASPFLDDDGSCARDVVLGVGEGSMRSRCNVLRLLHTLDRHRQRVVLRVARRPGLLVVRVRAEPALDGDLLLDGTGLQVPEAGLPVRVLLVGGHLLLLERRFVVSVARHCLEPLVLSLSHTCCSSVPGIAPLNLIRPTLVCNGDCFSQTLGHLVSILLDCMVAMLHWIHFFSQNLLKRRRSWSLLLLRLLDLPDLRLRLLS